ncbi:MAG: ASKHA domain-containing protein [Nitrospiraceae bacterium]|nr:ASKHA domain-containing protein [Nitrospiraceae bacterium]
MNLRIKGGPENILLKEGQSVLDALKSAEVFLTASCGGKGTCGKCKIKILEGKPRVTGYTKLTEEERASGMALACQTFFSEKEEDFLLIEIPESSRIVVGDKIAVSRGQDLLGLVSSMGAKVEPLIKEVQVTLTPPVVGDHTSDLDRLRLALDPLGLSGLNFSRDFLARLAEALRMADWKAGLRYAEGAAISIRPPVGKPSRYGVAVDIGTTTVVVYLVELETGRLVDAGSTYNSQIRYGDDVITRIVHATEGGGLVELRETVSEDINGILNEIARRHGIDINDIEITVLSGNTTMSHLFWGLPPASIREEPYVPTVSYFPFLKGDEAGLSMNRSGLVYTMPCIASYVGGDIVSGILASGMTRKKEIALFMDIGTNGEVAVGNDEWLMTAACSAGPCFEGSGIRHGMRATEGAIESVKITPGLGVEIGVIGNHSKPAVPRGICGSGMIDAISEMFLKGVIDRRGNFTSLADAGNGAGSIRKGDWGMEFVLAEGPAGDITLTGVDIENIIRAKAAIYAGVSALIKEVGLDLSAIEKVYIAGGFGNYLNVGKAVILGMLPDMPMEKFVFLGNTSITGSYLGLVSDSLRREAEEIASKMTYLELSVSTGFMEEYMSALFLPHTDSSQFPTVEKKLLEGK